MPEHNSPMTFTAGEALHPYRRVKLASGSGTTVQYADQTDSSSYVGVTLDYAASGAPVAVALKGDHKTFTCVAADTFAAGATLYAADDGKVSDSSSGNTIGTARQAATAAGDEVEVFLDNGSSSAVSPSSVANFSATVGGFVFVAVKAVSGAGTTAIYSAAMPRKGRVVWAHSINQSADDGSWKLNNGTNDLCSAVSVAASDTDIDYAADLDDAYYELDADDTLSIVHTGTGFTATVYVWILPVA